MKFQKNKTIKVFFFLITIISILTCVEFYGCKGNSENKYQKKNNNIVATINKEIITVETIDSMLSTQIYEIRMNAIEILISRKILENESKKQNIPLEDLVKKEISLKCKKITTKDFQNYIKQSNNTYIDTNNILKYLEINKQKERQAQYIDSLKNIYTTKILLKPSFFKTIETADLYSQNITENNSKIQVYIISDYKCPSCQKAENILNYLYKKYYNEVNFKFIYFSDYIGDDALACEAAAKQNKFKQMHDLLFENTNLLCKDSIYYDFAKKLNLNLNDFKDDFQNKMVLKRLLENKNLLLLKNIYSTPTFIVNGKVLDGKHAIDFLEEVIIEELKSCN